MVQRKQSRTRPQQHGTSKWTHSRPFVLQGSVGGFVLVDKGYELSLMGEQGKHEE